MGWNRIHSAAPWTGTLLDGIADAGTMYFVHSYTVQPVEPSVVLSTSVYGQIKFCSTLRLDNLYGSKNFILNGVARPVSKFITI